jgi:hypothetical protein
MVSALATAFLAPRILCVLFYLTGRPGSRTAGGSVELMCNLAIFLSPVRARR